MSKIKLTWLNGFMLILSIYIVISGIFLIYWLVLKLTGHSPTNEEIIIAVIFVMLPFVVKNSVDLAKLNVELKHTNKKLDTLCSDFKDSRRDFVDLRKELNELRGDFVVYASKKR